MTGLHGLETFISLQKYIVIAVKSPMSLQDTNRTVDVLTDMHLVLKRPFRDFYCTLVVGFRLLETAVFCFFLILSSPSGSSDADGSATEYTHSV